MMKLNRKFNITIVALLSLFTLSKELYAQPYIDLVNLNGQGLTPSNPISGYRFNRNYFDDNLNLTLPVKLNKQLTILAKANSELVQFPSDLGYYGYSYYGKLFHSFAFPVGLQVTTKNEKWKVVGLFIPRSSTDWKWMDFCHDLQLGGTVLTTWAKSPSFKLKFGLYYNKEFFGNFFVPLAGIEWKVNDRLNIFGVLPNNMRAEYKLNKWLYGGLVYKNYQRSYRSHDYYYLTDTVSWIGQNWFSTDYIRVKEGSIKLFLDCYLSPKFVLIAEGGYAFQYSMEYSEINWPTGPYALPQYFTQSQKAKYKGFVFSLGLAYRIRMDRSEPPAAVEQPSNN